MDKDLEQRAGFYERPLSRGIKPFPDLIPGIGMITHTDRLRRERGEPIVGFYLQFFDPRNIITIGMRDWPKPTTDREATRSGLHQLVSVALALYNVGGAYGIYRGAEYGIDKALEFFF